MNSVFLAIHSCIQARTFKAEKNHMARWEANDSGKSARSLRALYSTPLRPADANPQILLTHPLICARCNLRTELTRNNFVQSFNCSTSIALSTT